MAAMATIVLWYLVAATVRVVTANTTTSCDHVNSGYTCSPQISHYWGQYSPYFSVGQADAPVSSDAVPEGCTVTFAQILSRHGARDPTASKTTLYNATINRIQSSATSYGPGYEFLSDFEYTLGADQLTTFGQQELINSGIKFYQRYEALARRGEGQYVPFVRTSGEDRVVESAQNWTQGFHAARVADQKAVGTGGYPYNMVVISEDTGSNNTLDHGLCTAFEDGPDSDISTNAQTEWISIFTRNITARLNSNLPGVNLTATETIYLMDLCPFVTVADVNGKMSEFCGLFTQNEWRSYDYYQSLGKYYGFGSGNPLGPTQGVGFTNELIARLTGTPVVDETSTNHTLDNSAATFPLNRTLYADFSHDNDMTGIFWAMGLYNKTQSLSNTTVQSVDELDWYSASWTVPFAARMYVEKLQCADHRGEELVRVIVNDRVRPLETCGGDQYGRCTLSRFVESLGFAREGGDWSSCWS
ncbi:histidine phosphatase superfamily [Coniella lustricola]|uniref:Phytase A n=1 Tax=Coniella lustricola TaxID=2025994 RepID=A0A2T3AD32_9PEZI|nr:histidine phosphatase superfamily [Coniella lustricola]